MRNASPKTAASVTNESASCRSVDPRIFRNRIGEIPRTMAERNEAIMHAVPEAASQFRLKTAAYGDTFAVTGGMRAIWLCRPGQGIAFVTEFRGPCIGL